MRDPEWIALRAAWLSRRTEKVRVPVEGWCVREGRQISECEYEYFDEEYRPLNKGDMFCTPDGTSFLKLSAVMPQDLDGKRVYMTLETTSEMIVKLNGKWLGGLDPNRGALLVSDGAKGGEKLEFEIEAYNRSKPDDERNVKTRHLRGCRQEFAGTFFVEYDEDIKAAMYDVQVLVDAMSSEYIREEIRNYISKHLDKALNFVDYENEDPASYRESVLQLRDYLKETVFESKKMKGFHGNGKVALVAHSHLDIAYFWRRIHAVQKNARTCLIQLRLMDEHPEFKYAHTQPFTYEQLENHFPDMFEELKERVKEGRFEPVGAMYIEPDCNVPTAESLIRQCFYGQMFYRSRFNMTVDNCWLPDVFGNSWILPQILKKCGVDYFVSNKMSTWNDTNRFPHNNFLWRGIDGTEIPACVPPTHFITWNTPDQVIENWEAFQEKEVCEETLNMFGYGDGGSGVTEGMLEYMKRLPNVPGLPDVRHTRGDEFLRDNLDNNDALEVWDGELYLEMHRGTFTTKGVLKKMNRRLEILLRDAEMLAAFATALNGADYPRDLIDESWKLVLINQFHDILPGTHIAPVTDDAVNDYNKVMANLETVISKAAEALGLTGNENDSLTLFNSLGWERDGVEFLAGDFYGKQPEGKAVQEDSRLGEKGLRVELEAPIAASTATAVDMVPAATDSEDWYTLDGDTLETPFYRVKLNEDGSFDSLFDKRAGRELVAPGKRVNKLAIYRDNPGMYDAWDILPNYKNRPEAYEVTQALKFEANGPVFLSFSVAYKIGNSTWNQTIRFFRNQPEIEFEHEVDWRERNRLAKAEFELDILSRTGKCDTSAGVITRETHRNTTWQQARFETCCHKWADLSEGGYGVAVLNESKYGVNFDKNLVGLSLLRGTIRPDRYADEGHHRFAYALLPHEGTPEEAGIISKGWAFNTPLHVFKGKGSLESLIHVSDENIHIQAVKLAEDENGLIVRVTETQGRRGIAVLGLSSDITSASKTNMLEDVLDEDNYQVKDGVLAFDYKPFEIHTFRLNL